MSSLSTIREKRPLVHCVTNLVAAHDCASLLLAVGASPIMAVAPQEAAEIAASSAALVLNTGTPTQERFEVCLRCGQSAQGPVVLDPVGIGASAWRLAWVERLLDAFTPTILRLNLGEALALLTGERAGRGVDSGAEATMDQRRWAAADLAVKYRTTVLLTGPVDIITRGGVLYEAEGGSPRLAGITGSGCMLSALCGAFAAVEPDPPAAAYRAAAFWRACAAQASQAPGPGSFHAALLDWAETLSLQGDDTEPV